MTGADTMETYYIIAGVIAVLAILIIIWMIKKAIKMMLIVFFLIVVVVVGAGCYFYFGYYKDDEDTTAPNLTETELEELLIDGNIVITFSEDMDEGSLIYDISPTVIGKWTYDATGKTSTFDPDSDLMPETIYTITVTGKDEAGNALKEGTVTVKTAAAGVDGNGTADTTPPALVTSSQTGVNVSVNISITFTEAMNKDTIKLNATCQDTAMVLNGTWTYDEVTFSITFDPSDVLEAGKTYVFALSGKDKAGNDLAAGTKFTATT